MPDKDAYYRQALRHHRQGNLAEAIAEYSESIRLEPDARTFYGRAFAFHTLGDYERADADYTAAIRLAPKFPEAYHNRAVIRGERGDLAGSLADFNLAMHYQPRNP